MKRLRASVREALGVNARRRRRVHSRAIASAGHDAAAVWEVIANMLLRFGGTSAGNSVEVYCDGDQTFEAMWNTIDSARTRVWHETYILEPDRVGTRTIEALAAAAKRGCRVRLLYDAIGSPRVTDAFLKPLRDAGGEIDRFNPLFTWKRKPGLLQRDHRKITVIDSHTTFTGGINTSEDYAGPRYGRVTFQDCHARLCGPCVRDLAAVTVASLALVRDVSRREAGNRARRCGRTFVQVLASRGGLGRRALQRAMRLTVRHSVERCWITNPYFLPPQGMMRAMKKAAKRGVDVRVLTAGRSDVPIVRAASQHIYGELLKHGVRIFEYFNSTLHAKTMTIDGLYGTVGSFNLDTWSDKRNLEVNVGMIDAEVARALEEQFETNLKGAKEVVLDAWIKRSRWQRLIHWCAYQLMRL